MEQYLTLCRYILKQGTKKNDRTKTGTLAVFGYQMRFDLNDGFPLLTTKKVNCKAIIHELLWFIAGDTNIAYLVKNKVNIWNEWPYEKYCQKMLITKQAVLSLPEFVAKIIDDANFAKEFGDLGPVYGKQWRNYNGIDQLQDLLINLKANPDSRRHILTSWNPNEIKAMALPPCHAFVQFYVSSDKKLSCQLYQRSGDVFLGIPFNIASYALLTMMIAQVCNYQLGELIHTIGDAHIYQNHFDQVNELLKRKPKRLAKMCLNPTVKNLFAFKFTDFTLIDYDPEPFIKAKVAV